MELFNNSVAAQTLHELLPEKTAKQWSLWLQNNRNKSRRNAYRIPIERLGGGVFYKPEDLQAFAEWESSRQLGTMKLTGRAAEVMRAFGIGDKNGSSTGRKLSVTAINPQIDESSGKPFVQFITSDPLMVYRLDPNEAKNIALELIEVANVCEKAKQ